MTPEERAKALIYKFGEIDDCDNHHYQQGYVCSHQAKQCAIICVEQIISSINKLQQYWEADIIDPIGYWQEVKKHLESI